MSLPKRMSDVSTRLYMSWSRIGCFYFSIGWLRLLHHCLTQCEEMESLVATVAAPIPDLLVTCTALLVSPSSIIYFTNIEAVLLRIGLHSTDIGLALIDSLLRNVGAPTDNSGASKIIIRLRTRYCVGIVVRNKCNRPMLFLTFRDHLHIFVGHRFPVLSVFSHVSCQFVFVHIFPVVVDPSSSSNRLLMVVNN